MRRSSAIIRGGAFFAAMFAASALQAQVGAPYGYGGYWFGPPYSTTQREHLPYFALHPPVYYSVPVPRTFGYSPFAYPPGVMTPEVKDGEPLEIRNPYVPEPVPTPRPKAKSASDKTAGGPLMIINPYVDPQPVIASGVVIDP